MPSVPRVEADSPHAIAEQASAAAGVSIAELDGSDVSDIEFIIESVWGPEQNAPSNLLRGLAHAGNVLLVAHAGDGRPLGFTMGYLGWADGLHLHSHMTAVIPDRMTAGVGYALKLWQRRVCLDHGVDEIRWTYDPMIARNAYFNLVKLGATVREFHPDFYPGMRDRINAGDRPDRFEVSWQLDSPRVVAALGGVRLPLPVADVPIPEDFEALRGRDLAAASAVREEAGRLIADRMARGERPVWGVGGYAFAREEAR